MKRRSNQEGSIRKRSDGRWEARLVLGNGERKSLYGETRQEVTRLLSQAIRDREAGISALGDRQTVEQYLVSWLEVVTHTIKPRTWQRYRELVQLHIIPTLGSVTLSKLTAQQVQNLYAAKLNEGLSSTTVHHIHAVLHRALAAALRLGLVARNVTDMVDPPAMRHPEMTTLSEEQVRALLAAVSGDRLEAFYVLALATGMRVGELLALKWRYVDLDRATLQVRATLHYTAAGYVFSKPKTKRSRRHLALSRGAIEALQLHRVRQDVERKATGAGWTDLDLVFPNSLGKPLDNSNILKYWFRPLLQRAELPPIRLHDLRHTAATLLLSRGINPKVASEMLGHSSVSITLDLYSHVLPHMLRGAADVMDEAMGHREQADLDNELRDELGSE